MDAIWRPGRYLETWNQAIFRANIIMHGYVNLLPYKNLGAYCEVLNLRILLDPTFFHSLTQTQRGG